MDRCSCPVGLEIKFHRQDKGLTLVALSEVVGRSYKTLEKVELRKRPADMDLVADIARELDLPHLAKHFCRHECTVAKVLQQISKGKIFSIQRR